MVGLSLFPSHHTGITKKLSRLNFGIACFHSIQNHLSLHIVSKEIKIKMCETYYSTCFAWVKILVCHPKGRTYLWYLRMGAEDNIWNWQKVIVAWRNLRNFELHNVYSSPNIIRMIKSRMGWDGQHIQHAWDRL